MDDPKEREQESRASDETRFEAALDEEQAERERLAAELEREGPLEPDTD